MGEKHRPNVLKMLVADFVTVVSAVLRIALLLLIVETLRVAGFEPRYINRAQGRRHTRRTPLSVCGTAAIRRLGNDTHVNQTD